MTNAANIGHNNAPRCADEKEALKLYGQLGAAAAAGDMKGAEFLEMVAENVRLRHHEVSPKKAQEIWGKFRNAQMQKLGNLNADAMTEANYKQRASNVSTVMIAAAKPGVDLNDVFTRARPVIVDTKQKGVHKMNTWDAFVALATKQKAQETALTDADILSALEPKAKTEKVRNEITSLNAIVKLLETHINGTNPTEKSPGKEAFPSERAAGALQLLKDQITLLEYEAQREKMAAVPQFNLIKKA